MASSAIDGLVSGLDTTSLINSLMQLEAAPQRVLKSKQSTSESLVTALQGLNSKLASLAETATTATKPASWSVLTAKVAGTGATATASASARPGSMTFAVDRLATARVALSRATADDSTLVAEVPPAVTIDKRDGTFVTVQPTTGSLADIATAINGSREAGVRATVVRVSDGATPTYRLQFTGTATGVNQDLAVYAGTQAQVEAALADGSADTRRLDTSTVTAAQDAQVTLWKGAGVGVETPVRSATNAFTGVLTGVDLTVSAVTKADEPAPTVTVARDEAALEKLASNLVSSLGVALSDIASRTKPSTTVGSDGRTVVKGGLLSGDAVVRGLQQSLLSAASQPVNGASPSEVGIRITRDGTFTFDAAAFKAALAKDPAKVQAMVTGIAERVATVATEASDPTKGTLTAKVTGQQSLVKDYGAQIESWDRRLELRRTTLEKTYAALEVQLSKLNAQSSWLTSQLDALTASTKS